jgi:hypothetical protein
MNFRQYFKTVHFAFGIWLIASLTAGACRKKTPPEDPAAWRKIKIDFKRLDAEGYAGPANGKVAVQYEYCIPRSEKNWKQVRAIDPTAQRPSAGRGRVGCSDGEWLIFGTTTQKNYQRVLFELASLPYVARIEEVFWE